MIKNTSENLYMGLITLLNPEMEGALCQTQTIVRAPSKEQAEGQIALSVTSGEWLPEDWKGFELLRVDASVIEEDSLEYATLEKWFTQKWQAEFNTFNE